MTTETAQSWLMISWAFIKSTTGYVGNVVHNAFHFCTHEYAYLASMLFGVGFATWMGSSSILTFGIMALSAMSAFQITGIAVMSVTTFLYGAVTSLLRREPKVVAVDEELADELRRHFRGEV